MRISYSWMLAVVVALVALLVILRADPRGATQRFSGARHVVFISMDTTRADHFGCMGARWARTPRIDALAREGVLFTDYLNVTNTTLASHTSLMTGRYPQSHGAPRNGFMIHPDNEMLAESLKKAGFTTAAFLGSFALESRFGFSQGFDHFDEEFDTQVGENGADQNQRRGERVTDAALRYLDSGPLPSRLFLFAHYFDPHAPYDPPPPFDQPPAGLDAHPALNVGRRDDHTRAQIERYEGEIAYMDAQIGRLVDGLRQRGVLDECLLVITSDHGENLTEHWGRPFDHGWTVYGTETHGFCLVRPPPGADIPAARSSAPVMSIDITPTVVSFLGLPAPSAVDGVPLDLRAPNPPGRRRFSEATKPWEQVEPAGQWYNALKPTCVLDGAHKLILTGYQQRAELYDLARDPFEQTNLLDHPSPEAQQIADQLRKALQAWRASAQPLPTRFEPAQQEETLQRLRSMGYVGSSSEHEAESQPASDP